MSKRDNQAWLVDLSAGGEGREAALADLHQLLLSTMPYGLSRWLSPGDPQFDTLIEDAAQETLVRVIDRLNTFEGRSQFTTWAYKIAVHFALTELRRQRWKDFSLDELTEKKADEGTEPDWMAAHEARPETVAERRDMMARIRRIIEEELPPKQKRALMAIAIKGVPMDEVARRMNTNRGALYKLLHDARLTLKRRIEREGLHVEEVLEMFQPK